MFAFHPQGAPKHTCTLLAVTSGTSFDERKSSLNQRKYPFPDLVSAGRLEVQTLRNPEKEQFRKALESYQPNFVYLQGELLENGEVGSLVWQGVEFSTCEDITELFGLTLPTAVYLEIPNGESFAEALHFKGIPYVIFWRNAFSCYAACHFRQAFLSVVQSGLRPLASPPRAAASHLAAPPRVVVAGAAFYAAKIAKNAGRRGQIASQCSFCFTQGCATC